MTEEEADEFPVDSRVRVAFQSFQCTDHIATVTRHSTDDLRPVDFTVHTECSCGQRFKWGHSKSLVALNPNPVEILGEEYFA